MLTSGRLVDFDRNIAPLVAAGLISAAGSVAGAGINSASQSIANKIELEIHSEGYETPAAVCS